MQAWFDGVSDGLRLKWYGALDTFNRLHPERAPRELSARAQLLRPPSDIIQYVKDHQPHPCVMVYAMYMDHALYEAADAINESVRQRWGLPAVSRPPVASRWTMYSGNCRCIELVLDSWEDDNAHLRVTKATNITSAELRVRAPDLRCGPQFNTAPKNLRLGSSVLAKLSDNNGLRLTHIAGVPVGDLEVSTLQREN